MQRSTFSRIRRRARQTIVVAAACTLSVPVMFPEGAQAAVEDQRREVERIVDELERLGEQSDILTEDYAEAVDQFNQLTVEVGEAEVRVAEQEEQLAELRGDLSEVAVRSLTGSGTDVLGPLFSNADVYSDDLRADQFSRVALSVGTGTTDDLDELISQLDDERAELDRKRAEADALAATIDERLDQTEDKREEYLERRATAEARLGELIAEEEARRAAEAYAALQAELAAQQSASSGGSSSGGSSGGSGGSGGSTSGGSSSSSSSSGGSSGGSGGGSSSTSSSSSSSGGSSGGGGGGGGASAPAVSGLAGVAVSAAYGQLGVPYRFATSKPGVSFDCSGLTYYSWAQAGIALPRNSRSQAAALPRVPAASAQPGDLIFFYSPISHVGIYVGGGQMVHAPNTGSVVSVAGVSWGKVSAVGRPG